MARNPHHSTSFIAISASKVKASPLPIEDAKALSTAQVPHEEPQFGSDAGKKNVTRGQNHGQSWLGNAITYLF